MGMTVDTNTIRAAFEQHRRSYAADKGAWDIGYHCQCWSDARAAFEGGDSARFQALYEELRRRWQAFRSKSKERWSADQLWNEFACCQPRFSKLRLTELTEADTAELCTSPTRPTSLTRLMRTPGGSMSMERGTVERGWR